MFKKTPFFSRKSSSDISSVLQHISKVVKRIPSGEKHQNILILGARGVGKSTLAYMLAERKLYVQKTEQGDLVLDIKNIDPLPDIKISHGISSLTLLPGKTRIGKKIIWDVSGLFPNSIGLPEEDIITAFGCFRFFECANEVKFVIVFQFSHLKDRAQQMVLIQTIEHFCSFFEKIEQLKESLCILVTKVDEEKPKKLVFSTLQSVFDLSKALSPKARSLISSLSEEKNLEIFPILKEEGELRPIFYRGLIETIDKKLSSLKLKTCKIQVGINPISISLGKTLLKKISENLSELLETFDQVFSANCIDNSALVADINQEFFRKWLKTTLTERQPHIREYLMIESLKALSKIFDNILQADSDSSELLFRLESQIQEILIFISQFQSKIELLNNKFHKNHEREEFEEKLIETSCFMRFLIKALKHADYECNVKRINLLIAKLNEWKEKIDQKLEATILGVSVFENEPRSNYYDKLLEFLSPYENSLPIQQKISACHHCLSKVYKGSNLLIESIVNAINAYLYNSSSEEVLLIILDLLERNPEEIRNLFGISEDTDMRKISEKLFWLEAKKLKAEIDKGKSCILKVIFEQEKEGLEFIEVGIEYLKRIREVNLLIPIKKEEFNQIPKVFKLLTEIIDVISHQKDGIPQIIAFCDFLRNLEQKQLFFKLTSEIVNSFDDSENVSAKVIEKIKVFEDFDEEKTGLTFENLEKLLNFIEFMKDVQNNEEEFLLEMESNIFIEKGKRCLNKGEYKDAKKNFLLSLDRVQDQKEAIEGLEALFLLGNNLTIPPEIFSKVAELAFQEFEILINKRVTKVIFDFIGESEFFRNELVESEMVAYLIKLQELKEILKDCSVAMSVETFLEKLARIEEKFEGFDQIEKLKDYFENGPKVVVEAHFKPLSLFGMNMVEKQLNFLVHMDEKRASDLISDMFNVFDPKIISLKVNEKNLAFTPNFSEKDIEYFQAIVDLKVKLADEEPIVNKDVSLCYQRLGELTLESGKEGNEALDYYEQALDYNEKFKVYCKQNSDLLSQYKPHSQSKKLANILGDLYFSKAQFKKAFKIYRISLEFSKIMDCFKKIGDLESNPQFWEEKGDFYQEIGFVEKSLKAYFKTIEKIIENNGSEIDIARIYKKMGHTLESSGDRVKYFSEKAEFVEKYGI